MIKEHSRVDLKGSLHEFNITQKETDIRYRIFAAVIKNIFLAIYNHSLLPK